MINFIVFGNQCVNKFHICTLNATPILNDPQKEKYRLQMSLSNGLVLEETFESEEACGLKLAEITGVVE